MNTFVRRTAALCSLWLGLLAPSLFAADVDPALQTRVTDGQNFGTWGTTFSPQDFMDLALLAQRVRDDYLPDGYLPRRALNRRSSNALAAGASSNGAIFIRSSVVAGLFRIPPENEAPAVLVAQTSVPALVQPDGKTLLLGVTPRRVNSDGTEDGSFSIAPQSAGFFSESYLQTVGLQADGKILVGGTPQSTHEPALVRFLSHGARDSAFAPPGFENVVAVLPLSSGQILVAIATSASSVASRLVILSPSGALEREVVLDAGGALINDMAEQPGGQVILAGRFELAGGRIRDLARFDPATGSFDATFARNAYTSSNRDPRIGVTRIDLQPDGRILFATDVRVGRLLANGAFDVSYVRGVPTMPGRVELSRDPAGRLLLGGEFVTVNATARPGLARLNTDGTLDDAFRPDEKTVLAVEHLVALNDGSVVVSGQFQFPDTTTVRRLAKFTPSGALDEDFNVELDPDGIVHALLPLADGRLLVAGNFTAVNGTARNHFVALRADGSIDGSFAQVGFDGEVEGIVARPGGGYFARGRFATVNNVARRGLVALGSDGALDTSFMPDVPAGHEVSAIAPLIGGGVAVGFAGAWTIEPNLVKLTPGGARDLAFQFPIASGVDIDQIVEDSQGRLIVAYTTFGPGPERTLGGLYSVQRFLANGSLDTTLKLGSGTSGRVDTMLLESDERLIVAGGFDRFDDLPTGSVVRVLFDRHTTLPSLLFNVSTRSYTAPGDNVVIAGFVIGGTTPKTVLIRGVGPTLGRMGVSNPLTDPMLTVYKGQTPVGMNVGWLGWPVTKFVSYGPDRDALIYGQHTGAFPLESPDDAALVMRLEPGPYTVHVAQRNKYDAYVNEPLPPTDDGVTLVEVYDVNALPGDRRLMNISSRGRVGGGDEQLIAGFVISGNAPRRVLVRAVGPTLATLGVPTALTNPMLTLMKGQQAVASNDDWNGSAALTAAFDATGAMDLPVDSKDSALIVTLQPGAYTAIASSADGTPGIALVEVYDHPME